MTLEQKFQMRLQRLFTLLDTLREGYKPLTISSEQDFIDLQELVASSAQFVLDVYGIDSAFYKEISKPQVGVNTYSRILTIQGILNGIKTNIEHGYITTIKNEILAEFTGDYLEMATYLNNREGLHIAAAVIAGTTLEERVRQLARNYLGTDIKDDGEPEKIESLNVKLKDKYTGGLTDQRLVTKEYGVRTQAAHGHWNSDKDDPVTRQLHRDLVTLQITSIQDFIRRNPL